MRWTLGKVGVGEQGLSRRPLRATRTRALVGSPEARVDPGTSHVTPAAPPPDPPAPTAPASRTPCAGRRRLSGRWRPCGFRKSRGFSGLGLGGSGRCGRPRRRPGGSAACRPLFAAVRGRSLARGLRGADPGGGAAHLGPQPCRFSLPEPVARE